MVAEVTEGGRILGSAVKCFALLDVVAQAPEAVGVAELARLTGANRGTVHQQVATLVHAGWIERVEGRRYRLALKAARLAAAALEQANLGVRIKPVLESLADATSEGTVLVVLDGTEAVIVQRARSTRIVRADLGVGWRMPLATSAAGRVLVAFAAEYRVEALHEQGVTLPSDEILRSVRANGYSLSLDELLEDISAAAAPVFDSSGGLLAALSAAGPSTRFDVEAVVPLLVAAARDLSEYVSGRASVAS